MSNREVVEKKTDIAVADLITNGGFNEIQTATFLRGLVEQPTILREVRVVPMTAAKYTINKMGIGQRALHGAPAQGTALDAAKRTKTTTSKIVLNSQEVMAEVHIPYNVMADSVERGNIGETIMSLVIQKCAIDLEELLVNGDTSIDPGTDDLLCLCDGILKRASAHVIDRTATPVSISLDPFSDMLEAMPNKYLRNVGAMRHYVSPHSEIRYAKWLATKQTGMGDARTVSDWKGNFAMGVPMAPCANIANTIALFGDPKNYILGVQKDISIETDRDIRTRELIFVITLRVDVQIEEPDAVVKFLGLLP